MYSFADSTVGNDDVDIADLEDIGSRKSSKNQQTPIIATVKRRKVGGNIPSSQVNINNVLNCLPLNIIFLLIISGLRSLF